jgi:HEAT repeat protein
MSRPNEPTNRVARARKERPWLVLFGSSMFLLTASTGIYWAVLQSFVVKRMGGSFLPYFFLLTALASIVVGAFSIRILRNWSASRQGFAYLLLGGVAALGLAVTQPHLTSESPLVARIGFIALGAAVISGLVQSPLDKIKVAMSDALPADMMTRLEPQVTAIGHAGFVMAGLFLAFLGERLGQDILFWMAAAVTILGLPAYLLMAYRVRKAEAFVPSGDLKSSVVGFLSDFPAGAARKAVVLLTAIAGLTIIFGKIFQYEFILATGERFADEAQVSAFIGSYFAAVGLALVAFVGGLRRFLLQRFGLTRNLHVPTLLVTLGVIASFFAPGFVLVVGVIFLRDVIMAIQQYVFTVMLQSVGDRQRNQAWSWIDGPVAAVTGLVGSALLLLFPPKFFGGAYPAIQALSLLVLALLLVRFALTLRLQKLFPEMLVEGLKKGDFKTRLRAIALMEELQFMRKRRLGAVVDVVRDEAEPAALRLEAVKTLGKLSDPSTLRVIAKVVGHSDAKLRREAIKAITRFDFRLEEIYQSGFSRETLIVRLREIFRDEANPDTVRAILDALIALRDEEVVPLLIECLHSKDTQLKRSCLLSLRRFSDATVIDEVRELLDDPEPSVRADAIAALWQFPWERPDKLVHRLEKLVQADWESRELPWGVYLVGELKLNGYRKLLQSSLVADNPALRLAAGVSLLKLGDLSGLPPVEQTLADGTATEAAHLATLAEDSSVPAVAQAAVEQAIHRHHLHYPPDLPVTEPLRRRLAEISREGLTALMPYYPSPQADTDRSKIEIALPKAKAGQSGRVALYGLNEPWITMAAVHLLAHNYAVRVVAHPEDFQPDEVVIAEEKSINPPPQAILLSERAGERRVVRSHYAPSELRREVENSIMSDYL